MTVKAIKIKAARTAYSKRKTQNYLADFREWDSFESYLDDVENVPASPEWGALSSTEGNASFSNTDSFDDALKLAWEGWAEGLNMMSESVEELRPYTAALTKTPDWEFAPAGALPNVAAYCAGDPCSMMTPTVSFAGGKPIVRFLVNITASAFVSAETMMRRGAAILSVIEYLESGGMSCELVMVEAGREERGIESGSWSEYRIMLKHAGAHLDMDRVAFALAHPSMLRRLLFRTIEQCGDLRKDGLYRNYGHVHDVSPDPGQIYLKALTSSWEFETPETALRTILAEVRKVLTHEQAQHMDSDWKTEETV